MKVATLTHPDAPTVQVVTWDGTSREMSWSMLAPGTDKVLGLMVPLSLGETDFTEMVNKRASGWKPTFVE